MLNKKDPSVNALARAGGLARARTLTPEKRSQIAKKAATARWGRYYEVGNEDKSMSLSYKMEHVPVASESFIVRDVEMNAYEEILRKVQRHTLSGTCPCDECVDTVMGDIRDRYLTILTRIDKGEKLDKKDSAFFQTLIGRKANRWTRIYRKECKIKFASLQG